jgi:pimeloyl-ACP methyl ester carboxylesterase
MQSSSQLFPVALVRAELYGDLTEDVYLLKPNNSPDVSVELSLTRLGKLHKQTSYRPPVILIHGAFGNRFTWYAPRGAGLGLTLVNAGFDVWVAEMRGHGYSPRNLTYTSNQLSDYAHYDLPAIAAFIEEQSGLASHWIGHAQGGLALALSLQNGWLSQDSARSLCLLGVAALDQVWNHLSWRERMRSVVSGYRAGIGPEDEPKALLKIAHEGVFGKGQVATKALAGLSVLGLAARSDPMVSIEACQAFFKCFEGHESHFEIIRQAASHNSSLNYASYFTLRESHEQFADLILRFLNATEETSKALELMPDIELID